MYRSCAPTATAGAYCGKPVHFIGHLQTNKIRKVLGRAAVIQSVDSPRLVAALEKEASKMDIVQDILLEVNIGEEASKTGVSPEELWALLDLAAAQPHLRVKGLMAIPPVNEDDAQNRALLGQVYKLFVRAGERGYDNVRMEILSMGMSGDFENAIRGRRHPGADRHRQSMAPGITAPKPERAKIRQRFGKTTGESTWWI